MNRKRPHDDLPQGLGHNPFAKLRAGGEPAPKVDATEQQPAEPEAAGEERLVVRREKRGRAGKTVTRVSGLSGEAEALGGIARDLKQALGCGATVEDGDIVLQGALTERAAAWLRSQRGARVTIGN